MKRIQNLRYSSMLQSYSSIANSINIIKNTTSLVRDDYKELCNLCLSYLGDPEHITNEPALQRPEESDLQHLSEPHDELAL